MAFKRGSTLFLRAVIVLIGLGALTYLIWFPQTEGRAANLSLIRVYADPLILYGYVASIPFFVALYQVFKLLGYVDRNQVFSQAAVDAARTIKYCALATPVFILIGMAWIRLGAGGEDSAGPVALGILAIFASLVIAAGVAVVERQLQNAVEMKSENDLTV